MNRVLTETEYARQEEARTAAFWAGQAASLDPGAFVAEDNGTRSQYWFNHKRPVTGQRPEFRGFNGARWSVRFRDGRGEVEVNDLYGGQDIPEQYWGQFPVTADLELLEARPKS